MKLTPEQVLARFSDPEVPVRVRTIRDLDPLGYAAAMVPAILSRKSGNLLSESIVLRNINHGGSPVEGSTVLCSAEITPSAIEVVEFVLVPLDHAIPGGMFHHAQLRFVFAPNRGPRLMGIAGQAHGSDDRVDDLVLSWEAWRAPSGGFSVLRGLDSSSYDLTMRAYTGPQRFLEDGLGRRDWYCYPLHLPGGNVGLLELFRVAIVLGDSVARSTTTRRLAELPSGSSVSWEAIRNAAAPIESEAAVVPSEETYQTLLRSCATMALHSICLTLDRLRAAGHVDGVDWDKVPRAPIEQEEPWMRDVAGADLGALAKNVPRAIKFFKKNPASLPSHIPDLLCDAGVIPRMKKKPLRQHYTLQKDTPYGKLSDHLMR